MRSARLATHLAWRNIRRRPAQAALILLTLTMATGMFGVGIALYGSADGAWDRVWKATDGFHVSASYYRGGEVPRTGTGLTGVRRRFTELAAAPGVRAVGGPWLLLHGRLDVGAGTSDARSGTSDARSGGGYENLTAEVRHPGRSPVDQPLVTAGSWLTATSGGIVLEQGLASSLHAGPGDHVRIDGRGFTVRGVAMTVSQGRFPLTLPALVWVTPATANRMRQAGLTEEGLEMQLRLGNPDNAAAFAAAHRNIETSTPTSTLSLETWRQRRAASHSDIDELAGTVLAAGVVVGLLAVATAALIVADRMAAQTRQIGTLKAIGVTPRQIVLALLAEHLALAGLATLIALGAGRLIAPQLARTSLTVLGDPETPGLSAGRVAVVAGVAIVVVALSTVRPALRGLRHTTIGALATQARPPRRPARLARLAASAHVPLAAVLGLRSAWRRPSRLFTNAVGLTLAVAMIVVAAGLRASLSHLTAQPTGPGEALSGNAVGALYDQVRIIVLATAALLLVLGTVNAFIAASFAARDAARNHAMLRAVGATPRQTVVSLVVSQFGACVLAVAAGIPLGLGLWQLIDEGDLPPVSVPDSALALVAVAVPLVFTAAVSLPASRLARRPAAAALAYE